MKFSKIIVVALPALLALAPLSAAVAQPISRAAGALSVSSAATTRIAAEMDKPLETPPKKEPGTTVSPTVKAGPAALFAFGVALLAAPISLGGAFSR
ncbi:MAG: hypothetical protein ACPGRZ_10735 [Alphaproteobacteria bacterium]